MCIDRMCILFASYYMYIMMVVLCSGVQDKEILKKDHVDYQIDL